MTGQPGICMTRDCDEFLCVDCAKERAKIAVKFELNMHFSTLREWNIAPVIDRSTLYELCTLLQRQQPAHFLLLTTIFGTLTATVKFVVYISLQFCICSLVQFVQFDNSQIYSIRCPVERQLMLSL